MKVWRASLVASAIFACCAAASARPLVKLHLSGVLLQRVDAHVKETPVEGLTLKGGDVIRYSIVATNAGTSPAMKLVPAGQIPRETSYVSGSARARGATAQFTLDGKTWSMRPMLSVRTAHGVVSKPADPALYRAIRWISPHSLAPHKTLVFSYDVRVNGRPAGK